MDGKIIRKNGNRGKGNYIIAVMVAMVVIVAVLLKGYTNMPLSKYVKIHGRSVYISKTQIVPYTYTIVPIDVANEIWVGYDDEEERYILCSKSEVEVDDYNGKAVLIAISEIIFTGEEFVNGGNIKGTVCFFDTRHSWSKAEAEVNMYIDGFLANSIRTHNSSYMTYNVYNYEEDVLKSKALGMCYESKEYLFSFIEEKGIKDLRKNT